MNVQEYSIKYESSIYYCCDYDFEYGEYEFEVEYGEFYWLFAIISIDYIHI